jgi:uncharacterized RmlC-like cupin family protein
VSCPAVRVIRPAEFDASTAQTPGMTRLAGVAAATCGASGVWMGHVTTEPGFRSGAHHHGGVESAIYVLSGRMRMRWGERLEHEARADAGDFLFVPAGLVHQEINALDDEPLVLVVARGGQENVVVNVELPAEVLGAKPPAA